MSDELNPNHPVTKDAHDHWHKVDALMMFKLGVKKYVISPDEVFKAFKEDLNITVKFSDDEGIVRTLVDSKEAARLAREEGGI